MKNKRNVVRLTENELKKVISESVKKILKEDYFDGKDYGFGHYGHFGEKTPDWKQRDYDKLNNYIDNIQAQEKERAQDLDNEIMDIQLQHSQGKKPHISQRAKDFFKQERNTKDSLKQSEPTLNKFQQRHRDNVQRKEKEQYEQERERQWQEELENAMYIIKSITNDEIEDMAISSIANDDDHIYLDSIKIIDKRICKRSNGMPCLDYDVLIKVKKGDDINYSSPYCCLTITTLKDYDRYFDDEFQKDNPKSRQYRVSDIIEIEDIENHRDNIRRMAQSAWDEEDRIYGHDNFDDM